MRLLLHNKLKIFHLIVIAMTHRTINDFKIPVPPEHTMPHSLNHLEQHRTLRMMSLYHKFMRTAAPPNSAAEPTTPVIRGAAMPELLELPLPPALVAEATALATELVSTVVVASATPLVNGVSEAELASENAGS